MSEIVRGVARVQVARITPVMLKKYAIPPELGMTTTIEPNQEFRPVKQKVERALLFFARPNPLGSTGDSAIKPVSAQL